MLPGDPGSPSLGWWISQVMEMGGHIILDNPWVEVPVEQGWVMVSGSQSGESWASGLIEAELYGLDLSHMDTLIAYFANGNALMFKKGKLFTARLEDVDPIELAEMYRFFDEMDATP